MKSLQKIALLALSISCSINLHAQDDTDSSKVLNLQEFVLTGTRNERDISTLPIPTQIISGDMIRKSGQSRLSEIIKEQTGLVTMTSFAGGEGIQIQGMDAAYTMILINGQPLIGRSAGTLDLSRISVQNIERIEVVKGASSCIYGSEALAGVVNIITREPLFNDKLSLTSNYKYGSFNTHDASINIGRGVQHLSVELFANYYSTQGYTLSEGQSLPTVSPFSNFTLQPQLKYKFNNKLNASLNTRWFAQSQDNKSIIEGKTYEGLINSKDLNTTFLLNYRLNNKLKLVLDAYHTSYKINDNLQDENGLDFAKNFFNQNFTRTEIRSHYTFNKNTLTTGIGLNNEVLNRTYFDYEAKLSSQYVYSQLEWFFGKKWNSVIGFRYDNHNQYATQLSPKLALNYKVSEALSIKSSVGYGYKAPDLRQLFFNFTNSAVGYTVLGYNVAEEKLNELKNQGQILFSNNIDFSNPLKPESSINSNLGAYYKKDKLTVEANLFHNSIKNLIDTRAIAQKTNGQNVFSYFNLEQIFTYGLELNSNYRLGKNLSIYIGYQYLIAKDAEVINKLDNGEIYARDPETLSSYKLKSKNYYGLFNRSRHNANLKFNYDIPSIKASANIRFIYRSKYGMFDSNGNSILDVNDTFVKGYIQCNLSANKDLSHSFSLQAGINNLLNYTDKANIPNLPGIQYFARLQYQL